MATAPTAPTGATFVGDFEVPLGDNWHGLTDGAMPVRVTAPFRLGMHSAKMTVTSGKRRAELEAEQGGAPVKIAPGSTWWFADSIYLASGFPVSPTVANGWQFALQFKDAGGSRSASPPLALDIHKGRFTLYGGLGCPPGSKPFRLDLAPATTGKWTDFEFQIHFDVAGKGWVDAYVNGTKIVDHYLPPCGTTYPAPYSQYQTLRVGYFRDPAIPTTGTIYHDEYRMGATRANVSLAAAPAPTPTPEPTPTPTPTPTPPPSGVIKALWTGAFETVDTSQYLQVLTPTQGRRIGFVTNPVLYHTHSCRMELRRGDTANKTTYYPNSAGSDGKNRNQYRAINYGNKYFNEGENRYFRVGLWIDPSTTIGASFSNPWRALVAWPSVENGAFSPLKIMLQRESGGGANPNGTDSLCVGGDLGGQTAYDITQWALRNPAKGAWHQFVFHWIFSGNAAKGLVEFWYRGPTDTAFARKTFKDGSTTKHMKTLSAVGHRANLRVGIYRNPSFTTTDVIFYDHIHMGSTFADVSAAHG